MAIISIPTAVGGVALPGALGQVASGPLAALFGGKSLTTLNYPQELATDATKTHYVQFSIKEVVPASYETTPSQPNLKLNSTTALGGLIQQGAGTQTGQSVLGTINNLASKLSPELASIGTNLVNGISTTLKEGLSISPPVKKLDTIISLYMPDTLTATYNAEYSEVSLRDALGDTINNLRSLDQLAKPFGDAAAGGGFDIKTGKKVFGAVSSDPNAIGLAVQAGSNLAGNIGADSSALNSILLQGQGLAINPQVQMVYKGLSMRTFQLSFTFTPKSQQEAKAVDNIIYKFKYHAAPTLTSGAAVSSQSMYLVPPSLFSVQFKVKGAENQYLPKYADCVLENIDVNYAPNGFAAHTDGVPVQTTLTLQFKELEIVDRGRLQKGFQNINDPQGLR